MKRLLAICSLALAVPALAQETPPFETRFNGMEIHLQAAAASAESGAQAVEVTNHSAVTAACQFVPPAGGAGAGGSAPVLIEPHQAQVLNVPTDEAPVLDCRPANGTRP